MERELEYIERWSEKYRGDELKKELLEAIKRGRYLGLLAAKEALKRFSFDKEILYYIITLSTKGLGDARKKEIEKIKMEAVKMARDFLDEKLLLAILREIEDKNLKIEISKEYLIENRNASKELLKEILKNTELEEAAQRLLKIAETPDDFMTIIENIEGKIQIQACQELFNIGISKENFVELVAFQRPILAKMAWEKGKEIGIFKDLDVKEIYDIARYTEVPEIKKDSLNLLWIKKKEIEQEGVELEEMLKFLNENAKFITIEKPERVKKWAQRRLIFKEESPLEIILEIQEKEEDREIKLEATEKAIERIESEIGMFKIKEIAEGLTIWEKNRLKFLEGKLEKLKREYSMLTDAIYSSP